MEEILTGIRKLTATAWIIGNYIEQISTYTNASQYGNECFLLIAALKEAGYSEILIDALVAEMFKHYPSAEEPNQAIQGIG